MKKLLFAGVLLWSGAAYAGYSGGDLKRDCDGANVSYCVGYITGSLNTEYAMLEGMKKPQMACYPTGSTPEQVVSIVMKYLNDNPKVWHYTAETDILAAIWDAFPCKRR